MLLSESQQAEFIKANYAAAMATALRAEGALTSANTTLSTANDLSSRIKSQGGEVEKILSNSNQTFAEAQTIKNTIDTSRALQDAENVLNTAKQVAVSYLEQLDKSGRLADSFDRKINERLRNQK